MCCLLAGPVIGLALVAVGGQAQAQTSPATGTGVQVAQASPFQFFMPPAQQRSQRRRSRSSGYTCPYPWSYSSGLRRCVCVREGFGLNRGRCVQVAAARPRERAETVPARAPADTALTPPQQEDGPPRLVGGIPQPVTPEIVQRCLKEIGYLKTGVKERMTPEAWTAFWYFKHEHDVGRTPDGINNPNFQRKVFPLCPLTTGNGTEAARQQQAALETEGAPGQQPVTDGQQPGAAPVSPLPPVYAKPELECLPEDLYRLITSTYGLRRDLKQCSQTCIPIPKDLSKAEIADYEERQGVAWCRSCIEIGSYLPLQEILHLERGTNTQICATPPSRLPRTGQAAATPRQPYTKVRAIYRAFRPAIVPGDRIAVVIGNRSYGQGLPLNAAAHNNAGAIYALLTEHLGLTSEDVIDLRDATLENMRDVFGAGGRLEARLKARPQADVLIYYAGHATTSADGAESYLLPVDAAAGREARTGFPMQELYDDLRRLKPKSTLLLLEAGFGRDLGDFVFPPNLPEMQVRSLPAEPAPGLTVIAAADRDQKTLDDPAFGVGLFTRYLIEGLAGQADHPPIGNGDGGVDAVELYAFTAHMTRLAARKSYGLVQKPTISRQGNTVVGRFQPQTQ